MFGRSKSKQEKEQQKAEDAERKRLYDDVLSRADRSKLCCEACTYKRGERGEYINPCKMGHDSGLNIESCQDHSEPRYHPKKK